MTLQYRLTFQKARIRGLCLSSLSLLVGAPFLAACSDDAGGPSGDGDDSEAIIDEPHNSDDDTEGGEEGSGGNSEPGEETTGGNTGNGDGDGGSSDGGGTTGGSVNGTGSTGGRNGAGGSSGGIDLPPTCEEADDWPTAQASQELEMLRLVNQVRASGTTCGRNERPPVGPLVMDPHLVCAARLHSQDMQNRGYFSHGTWNESADTCSRSRDCSGGNICESRYPEEELKRCGKGPAKRVTEIGGPSGALGENIAAGRDTAQGTLRQWLDSPGHCDNIMRSNFRTTGIGYSAGDGPYRHYWTQVFND